MATKHKSTKQAVALPPPPSKIASFTTVAGRLDDTAVLLHGLHCRHKNQHRVSTYWWPSFNQLRRAVTRLRDDVQSADTKNGMNRVTSRVGETRALVPKVYLAFSRLVADKQFAPLGLLLVGVLAQVQSAVNGIERVLGITADTVDAAHAKTGGGSDAPSTSAPRDNTGKQSASRSLPDIDFGVAISRDGEAGGAATKPASVGRLKKRARKDDSEEDVPKLAAAAAPGTSTTSKSADQHGAKPHAEKKRKIVDDNDDNRTITEHEGVKETAEEIEKREKKEKKGKREEKEKDKSKNKKKKRKRGDEFDDLFSGLL